MKPISVTKTTLSRSDKNKIFKVLNFKNQTAYIKDTGLKKQDAIKQAINEYNNEIKAINYATVQNRKEKRVLQQYGQRLTKTLKSKDTFTRRFKNDKQFSTMLDKLLKVGRKFLISWDGSFYAMSPKKIDDLRDYYKKNKSFFVEEKEQYTSDDELLYKLKEKTIKFQFVEEWGKYDQDNGAFFDKHHKTPFDLTDFQIYTETKKENYKNADTCFIHALKVGGLENKKLDVMRSMVKTKNLPKCMLGQLCEKAGIRVYVKMITITNGTKKNNITYGKEGELYELGLINNHYFLIKPMEITRYAVENFDNEEFIKVEKWQKKIFKGGRYQQDKSKFIDSFTLIKMLIEDEKKYLTPMTLTSEIYKTTLSNQFNTIDNLEYEESLIRENKPKEKKEKDEFVNEYFDFETTTDGEKHRPYLARVEGYAEVFVNKHPDRKNYDKWVGYQMLKFLVEKNPGKNLRLYAHNGGYDIKFIFSYIQWDKVIERGHSLLRGYGKFYYEKGKYVKIEIQDTKAYLVCALRDFKDMFKLDVKKEIIPYRMYNEKTMSNKKIWSQGMKTAEVKKYCEKEKVDFAGFLENCKEWCCVKGDYIDIIKYSSEYCRLDCEVLKNGWETFTKWMMEITELNVNDYISISSLVDAYFRNEGVYHEVHEVSSYVREFIQRCMVGGRCMTRRNEKYHLGEPNPLNKTDDVKISDFDGISLYPSSQNRLGGYLKGRPKVIPATNYESIKNYDGYFVELRITKVNKHLAFPLMSYKTEEGIRQFTNDMEGQVVNMDKIMLEDCIEHHGLEFVILRGYYYDEGRNEKLKIVIEKLFNERLKAKKNKNPIQVVYKLMMNASYGKTLIKPFSEDTKILSYKRALPFIARQYNKIKSIDILSNKTWSELEDFDKLKIKVEEPINEHFNNAPCGCEVLSMSKRIMNEVIVTAERYDMNIYYTDTDSMHIDSGDVPKLALTYAMKYGRELIGKGMGQFHSDFSSKILKGEIYACESIILGKKCYIDKLTDGETKDDEGNLIYDYHVRMKGMNKRGIVHRANADFDGDIMAVYKKLYTGEEIEFDLCGGGQMPTFDYQSNGTISSKMEFIRKIKF